VESHQRERIHRATTRLVAGGGRKALTVRKLTKLAGVSTATFYSQFDSADECLVGTYVSLMAGIRKRISAARAPLARRQTQTEFVLSALLDALVEYPEAGRLALIEIFGAGPAAIGPIRTEETLLESALRESLDRRGRRVSPSTVAWILAGALHSARNLLDSGERPIRPQTTRSLLRWGTAYLAEASPDLVCGGRPRGGAEPVPSGSSDQPSHRGNETELIVNSVLKLACAEGYWKLSVPRASKMAGIPATRFKRHFASLDEAYLLTLERTARKLFAGFGTRAEHHDWKQMLRDEVETLSASLADGPETAEVVFAGILAPGAEGLTRRETLIDQLARTWRATVPHRERPPALVARASMASLWSAFARAAESGQAAELPERAATHAYFFLAPIVGTQIDIPSRSC
jgi:AcrR family transcriptional regulator